MSSTSALSNVDAEICTAPSIKLDTGFMDSDLSFGMNAPPQNRVKYRKVTDCAPIEAGQFSAVKQESSQGANYRVKSALPEFQYVELYYDEAEHGFADMFDYGLL
ncbi:hypothetical protein HO133_003522 [Letharia lupina]|uniref:Uncharacterized protein n=1 Tax=Letharia lupina TaxID=560253 RepID=A0A8H6CBJ3_9LECA|nr:uncharacterized protein HO133_003522 [Letharia lupina]KAF6220390.1 hypothetical protein HO133_003522 [Letharia lupina]